MENKIKEKPLISIIVPIYNVEKYLNRCVRSLLDQTYSNIEILLIDDGSTDNCPDICDEYSQTDSRIHVVHKINGGLSDARNKGLEIAKGKFVTFVDSDDWISERFIEILYSNIELSNADVAVCDLLHTSDSLCKAVYSDWRKEYSNIESMKEFTSSNYLTFTVACGKLYRFSLFDEIRFPVGKVHEDEFTTYKALYNSNKVVYLKHRLYFYWQREGSITQSGFKFNNKINAVEALEERYHFFSYNNLLSEASDTLKKTFVMYLQIKRNYRSLTVKEKNIFKAKYKKFRIISRNKNLDLKFRLFIGLYSILPFLGNIVFSMFINRVTIKTNLLASLKKILKTLLRSPYYFINDSILKIYIFFKTLLNKSNIYFFATPCHGNLGDHAIVTAQYEFLRDRDLRHIIEIPNLSYYRLKRFLKKTLRDSDVIIIDGGGNLGTLWPEEDDKINEIVQCFKKNQIVIFPQTCYYSDDESGKNRIEKSKENFERHTDLTVCLRDKKSFDFMKNNFANVNSVYVPDIVLYLNREFNLKRDGVLLCFRGDLEKVISSYDIFQLKKHLQSKSINFTETDTVVYRSVNKNQREGELLSKWKEFASAGLVITDRLHGMIFSVITGTPCLAFDNKSKKVSGVYNWIKNYKHVKIVSSLEDVLSLIEKSYMSNYHYKDSELKEYYSTIEI